MSDFVLFVGVEGNRQSTFPPLECCVIEKQRKCRTVFSQKAFFLENKTYRNKSCYLVLEKKAVHSK